MNIPRTFYQRRNWRRTTHKAVSVCLIAALLAGLLPPPLLSGIVTRAADLAGLDPTSALATAINGAATQAEALLPSPATAQAAAAPIVADLQAAAPGPLNLSAAAPSASGLQAATLAPAAAPSASAINSVLVANHASAMGRTENGQETALVKDSAYFQLDFSAGSVLTVTKTVDWGDNTPNPAQQFAIQIEGPSFIPPTSTTIVDGQVLTFSVAPGVYTVTETSPGTGWVTTYTVDSMNSTASGVVGLTGIENSATLAATPISGQVFRDFNSDGLITASGTVTDTGVAGVPVTAYDKAGNMVGSAVTDANGEYTITPTGDGPYRVEFTDLPAGFEPSTHGTQNGASVQFVTSAGAASNVNFGIIYPNDFCQGNPFLATSCMKNGSGDGNSDAGYLSFALDAQGNGTAPNTVAQVQEVGSVWGNAYQRQTGTLFTSAFLKRHVGFGLTGIGGVYMLNMDNTTGAGNLLGSFDLQGVIPANSATAIDLGAVSRTTVAGAIAAGADGDNQLSDDPTSPNRDLDAYGKVGSASYGDIDLSDDGNTLWLVNLNQNTLIAVDVSDPAQLPTDGSAVPSSLVQVYPISGANVPTCGTDTLHPWGLKIYRGRGYIGLVCDAFVTQSIANLTGYVLSFNVENPTVFIQEVSIPFDYVREPLSISGPEWTSGAWATYFVGQAAWHPWTNTWSQAGPQPIISDIEFDLDGNMTLGVMDRIANQGGNDNYEAVSGSTTTTSVTSAGDILHICWDGNSWTVECSAVDDNANLTPITDDGALSNDGPSAAGEFYYNDWFYNHTNQWLEVFHWEIATGGLVYNPLADEVATTVFDPLTTVPRNIGTDAQFRTQGVHWYSASDGSFHRGYELVASSPTGNPTTFGKANGLGDLELLCDPAPLEIGNRVWDDLDGDGEQDAGEPGLNGLTVTLQTPTGISTTITSGDGNYYFSVDAYTAYTLTVATPAGYELTAANAIALDAANLFSNDAISDTIDSDALLFYDGGSQGATILYTTGSAGQNNHGLDFGFTQPINGQVNILNVAPLLPIVSLGNRVWYDTNNNGIVDGAEQNVTDPVLLNSIRIPTVMASSAARIHHQHVNQRRLLHLHH
ncbi:MAG: SdrD B-like domain-containing protein [Caldilineaceae bacterium]